MVLGLVTRGGQEKLYDSFEESSDSSSDNSVGYYGSGLILLPPSPPPPIFAKKSHTRPVFELEYFANKLDYSLCRERVDILKWPSEQFPKPWLDPPRAQILHLIEGRQPPPVLKKKKSSPQDIYQRHVPVGYLPIYNSENTATWRASTLYPDVCEQCTWISYKGQKPRLGVHYNSHHKLRNYY